MSNPIAKLRLNAFRKQAGLCHYCKSPMWLNLQEEFAEKNSISIKEAARFQCTAEHLIARCEGGNNKKNNIVAACIFCNKLRHQRKRPQVPSIYKKYIQKRLNQGKWHPRQLQHLTYSSFLQ